MFERYLKAYNNDLTYIEKLISTHPEDINKPWDGTGDDPDLYKRRIKQVTSGSVLMAPIFGGLLLAPPISIAISTTYILGSLAGIAMENKNPFPVSLREPAKRKDWALLDYAAAGGATEVAVYLILHGAETVSSNNYFLRVAKAHGWEGSFTKICSHALERRAHYRSKANNKQLSLVNDNTNLRKQNYDLVQKNHDLILEKEGLYKILGISPDELADSKDNIDDSNDSLNSMETKGDGDCLFHAILGVWNDAEKRYICPDIFNKRKDITNHIINCKQGTTLFDSVKECIQNMVMDNDPENNFYFKKAIAVYQAEQISKDILEENEWEKFEIQLYLVKNKHAYDYVEYYFKKHKPELKTNSMRLNFNACINGQLNNGEDSQLNSILSTLPDLEIAYKNYLKISSKEVNWDSICLTALNDYANYIGKQGNSLTPSNINIIAIALNKTIVLHTKDPKSHIYAKPEIYNAGQLNVVEISFDGINHYTRMVTNTEKKKINSHNLFAIKPEPLQIPRSNPNYVFNK